MRISYSGSESDIIGDFQSLDESSSLTESTKINKRGRMFQGWRVSLARRLRWVQFPSAPLKIVIKIMDEYSKQNDEGEQKKNSDTMPNDSDVPEPDRIRCSIRNGNEGNRFLLDYHRYFLPAISIILWCLFLLG